MGADEVEGVYVDVFAGSVALLVSLSERKAGTDGLDLGYGIRRVQTSPQLLLIARPRPHHHDSHVGFLRCVHGLLEPGLVVAPALAALGVVDVGFLADGFLDAVEGRDAAVLALVDDVVAVLHCVSK